MLAKGFSSTGFLGRPEEYFWDLLRDFYAQQWGLNQNAPEQRFLAMALRAGTTPNGVFAAKIHWFQMCQWLRRLRSLQNCTGLSARQLIERFVPAPHYVRLIRQDKVRQAISYYRALKSGVWWNGRPPETSFTLNGHVDFSEIERLEVLLARHEDNWTQFFVDSGISPLVVTYEELCDNYARVIREIIDYLGIVQPKGHRIGPPPLTKQSDIRTEQILQDYITMQRTFGALEPQTSPTRKRLLRFPA
jgi:LPS sulfotransferase NodH